MSEARSSRVASGQTGRYYEALTVPVNIAVRGKPARPRGQSAHGAAHGPLLSTGHFLLLQRVGTINEMPD